MTLSDAADVSGVLALLIVLAAYGRLHRSAREHLRAYLAAVRIWASGPAGQGWTPENIEDVETMLKWHHPKFSPLPLPVAGGLTQLTTIENLFLSKDLREAVVHLGIAVELFNSQVETLRAFDGGSVTALVEVSRKLSDIYEADDRDGIAFKKPVGREVVSDGTRGTEVSVQEVLDAAGLTAYEEAWARHRFEILRIAHGVLIGDAQSRRGIFGHLDNLERVLRAET